MKTWIMLIACALFAGGLIGCNQDTATGDEGGGDAAGAATPGTLDAPTGDDMGMDDAEDMNGAGDDMDMPLGDDGVDEGTL